MKPVNKTVCSLAALAPLAMAQSANAGQRPNIIFFLVDDFGWTETSLPFGEETYPNKLRFHTRNMERRARTGVMMTYAYACPVSTPTRTSMMTGMTGSIAVPANNPPSIPFLHTTSATSPRAIMPQPICADSRQLCLHSRATAPQPTILPAAHPRA